MTRHALSAKKQKAQQLTDAERIEGIEKLKAIKKKHAPKVLDLVRKAIEAVKGLRAIEAEMGEEAVTVHKHYNTVLSEFKLTFELMDSDMAEQYDHDFTGLEDCEDALEDIEKEACAAKAE